MKTSKILLLSIVIGGLATSCEKAYIMPVPEPVIDPSAPVDSVFYQTMIQPIFDNDCAGCHDGSGLNPDLTSGLSHAALIAGGYINTSAPSSSFLYTKIAAGGTMNSKLSNQGDIVKVKAWIQQGAKNN